MLPASGAGDPAPQPSSTPADIRAAPVPGDRVLAAERDHLRQSREFLRLMRENVLGLRAMGGDPVSEEYLKADLYRRAEALRDIPDMPLFFGRLDYAKDSVADEEVTAAGPGGQRRTDAAGDGGGGPGGQRCRGSACTSAGGTCTTARASRWSSTGGRRCRGRSTGPARPSRWAWRCGAGSGSPAASSPPTRTRQFGRGRRRAPAGRRLASTILIDGDRAAAVGPDARHRRHHPARPGRHRPRRRRADRLRAGRPRHRQDRGRPAPGRLPALRPRRAGCSAAACW